MDPARQIRSGVHDQGGAHDQERIAIALPVRIELGEQLQRFDVGFVAAPADGEHFKVVDDLRGVRFARTVARCASPETGAGQVTISVAEYRDLQNQARELQRMRSGRIGVPNRGTPFPDVRPAAPGNPARL
jgi:hypothetical protein